MEVSLTTASADEQKRELFNFLRSEFRAEEESGFARLSRIPDDHTKGMLSVYSSLDSAEKAAFADCGVHWAYASYSAAWGLPRIDHTKHPFFNWWREKSLNASNSFDSVPYLRTVVQQYKIDKYRKIPSRITEEQFAYASSIRSVKAPELRRRVKAALKGLGYSKMDEYGDYACHHAGRDFSVEVDYGGMSAQLRYRVRFPEWKGPLNPLNWLRFGFERTLGFGFGDWNFIVEENVEEVFQLFTEVIAYSSELPERVIRAIG